jgi:hypothetical protein
VGGYDRVSQVFAVTTTNIENQPNNNNHQITATTKIIKSPQQKTKQKINKYKLDRTGEVEGGAAAKPVRFGQNRRDLTRSGEVSLDLETLRGGGAGRDLPSPVVELDVISFRRG